MRGTIQLVVLRTSTQAGSGNSAIRTATNTNSNHQPNVKAGSSNQVRVGDLCHQQPALPRRSSSLLPTLRRRVSEPLTHSHIQRCRQRPEQMNTYGFKHTDACRGFDNEKRDAQYAVHRSNTINKFGFVSNSRPPGNLNRGRYDSEHTRSRMFADTHQGRIRLDNTHACTAVDAEGNMQRHADKSRHTRSRTLDDIHAQDGIQSSRYIENIRAMAGQMYGAPPSHSRITSRHHTSSIHSHHTPHYRVATRKHTQLSVGL
ncbi:hypothetical protein ILYODFUR_004125 [Ilyodon furcidens]|uniref:Uncharacterized protein n=1 Tax=Ilyodon furcidens TaxID=33524 RepID=A0ABV0VDS3_9TELE